MQKITKSTAVPACAAKSSSEKQGDLCRRASKNTSGMYDSPVPRPPPFLNTPTRPAAIRFGTRSNPYWYTSRVKEAFHIRLHPNNINRDSGIEIPEAWMPTNKKHNNRKTVQQPRGGGVTPIYGLYRYVPRDRAWFLRFSIL